MAQGDEANRWGLSIIVILKEATRGHLFPRRIVLGIELMSVGRKSS